MAKYSVVMRYIQGKTNMIADTLSRVSSMDPPEEDQVVPLVEVNGITNTLPVSPAKLDEIYNYTSQDTILSHLTCKDVIHHGRSIRVNALQT